MVMAGIQKIRKPTYDPPYKRSIFREESILAGDTDESSSVQCRSELCGDYLYRAQVQYVAKFRFAFGGISSTTNNLFHNIIPYTQIIPVSADHDRLPPHLPRTSRHGSRRYRIRPVIGATMVD